MFKLPLKLSILWPLFRRTGRAGTGVLESVKKQTTGREVTIILVPDLEVHGIKELANIVRLFRTQPQLQLWSPYSLFQFGVFKAILV